MQEVSSQFAWTGPIPTLKFLSPANPPSLEQARTGGNRGLDLACMWESPEKMKDTEARSQPGASDFPGWCATRKSGVLKTPWQLECAPDSRTPAAETSDGVQFVPTRPTGRSEYGLSACLQHNHLQTMGFRHRLGCRQCKIPN